MDDDQGGRSCQAPSYTCHTWGCRLFLGLNFEGDPNLSGEEALLTPLSGTRFTLHQQALRVCGSASPRPRAGTMGSAVSMCSSSSNIVSQPAPPSSCCKSMYCYPCHGVISSGPSAFLAGQVLRRPALLPDASVPTALSRVGASRGTPQRVPAETGGKDASLGEAQV